MGIWISINSNPEQKGDSMYILGFNGPPHSGKDSIALAVESILEGVYEFDGYVMSLAWPMREIGMRLLGMPPESNESYAEAKEKGHQLFEQKIMNMTVDPPVQYATQWDNLRQFMIWMSEQAIKPRYGYDFWARKLRVDADFIWGDNCVLLVPDIGFTSEIDFFEADVGTANVLIVQTHREGCDFAKDSPDWCFAKSYNFDLYNNSTIEWAAQQIVAKIINIGWKLGR